MSSSLDSLDVPTTETVEDKTQTIVRIDGSSAEEVDAAFDSLQNARLISSVNRNSGLNIGLHPQAQTALDVIATNGIEAIQKLLSDTNVSAVIAPTIDEDYDTIHGVE